MSWLNTHRTRTGRTLAPDVEALEERWVPSVAYLIRGSTLIISAPTTQQFAHSTIRITDNGTAGVDNVRVFAETPFAPHTAITSVVIRGGGGSEDVTYTITGPLSSSRTIDARLGGSEDSFQLNLRHGIASGSSLSARVNGGGGMDRIGFKDQGALQSGSSLQFEANGGGDIDKVVANLKGTVAAGASATFDLNGGGGDDAVRLGYGGRLDGTLQFRLNAGAGRDVAVANVVLSGGSTGTLAPSTVSGGGGADRLDFLVHDHGHAVTYNQAVNGGGGTDEVFRTSDVFPTLSEFDNVVL